MYYHILNQSLFFICLLMVFGGITISLVGNWIVNRRTEKASMDAYDQFIAHDIAQTDDREAEWLHAHEKTCRGKQGVLIRTQDERTNWTHLDVQKCCPECVEAWKSLYGAEPVVMPDFVDPRTEAKAAFAKVITLHPEQAA